jgi:hypothetical protein
MSIFRLLPLSLLIAVPAVSVAAQSYPEKSPMAVQSTDSGTAPKPLDRIRIDQYRPQLNQFGLPHVFLGGPDGQSQDGSLCYAMRSYKVARDDPHSDSTHAAGYSTCQPATRFHVHSTGEGVRPVTP